MASLSIFHWGAGAHRKTVSSYLGCQSTAEASGAHAGKKTCSIIWGAWAMGMAAEQAGFLQRLARVGLGAITPSQGLGALQTMLSTSHSQA